ncbi:hypothetical protein CMV_023777 [Castanea mollissima]|uniref:Uncharacterized protein n=1 Tax=Castanea mollissima TaxID=60419 RepID=A0A8J4QBP0_9ROSI|nr:hypothetical protein CMV_023777 [Castanea mollissima]
MEIQLLLQGITKWVKILVACNGVGEIFFSQAYNRLQHLQLCRRNKIGPTCNDQALTWMIARCSRKFGILGGKDNGFASDEICQTVTADDDICGTYIQALQTQDQGPQRPVRMSTAPDSCSW